MRFFPEKRVIKIDRELNELDKFVLDFVDILKKHVDYVIISGYVFILLGRSRATEDVDIFIKKIPMEKFFALYNELKKKGFWCLNSEKAEQIFDYLNDSLAVRFARKGRAVPNFEVKFPKRKIDEETFNDFITVILPKGKLKISSLERQIAFKKYFLRSEKDVEDALHLEELFKEHLNYNKINKLKNAIKSIEK